METTSLLRDETQVQAPTNVPRRRTILFLVAFCIIAVDFGGGLSYPPSIAIFESIICRKLNADNCKSPAVQGELALVASIKDTIDEIPSVVLALPFGLLADRIGRRPVLLICLYGLLLEEVAIRAICWWSDIFPLRLIWATTLAQVLGGGGQVATSLAYAMVSDVYPADERSSVFFLLAAISLIGETLASPTASLLMWQYSPWVPVMVGLVLMIAGLVSTHLLPETQHLEDLSYTSHDEPDRERDRNVQGTWSDVFRKMPLSHSTTCILAALLFASIGKQALQLVIQYASTHFGWTIGEAALLLTVKGGVTLVVLLVVLPQISTGLAKRMSIYRRDLLIVQTSAWSLTIGAALMALAAIPTLFIFGISVIASGWGFYSGLRSLAIDMVEPSQVGSISTAIAMAQSGGIIISGPILASSFRFGLSFDDVRRGFPYMVATAFFFTASCLVHCIPRWEKIKQSMEPENDERSE